MENKLLFAIGVLLIACIAMPVSAYPTSEGIQELKDQMKVTAPKLPAWSLPYNILTAADMAVQQGDITTAKELLTTHYTNALIYQERFGKITDPQAQQLIFSAMMLAYS
jgi:hypothetical protein